MGMILDGKAVSASEREKIAIKTKEITDLYGVAPTLAVIIVGTDPASQVYVRNKHRACEAVGIRSIVKEMPENTTEEELVAEIEKLNADDSVHGILVQLPLPRHINEERIINTIAVGKDVDAFSPENVGKIMIGNADILPCTPAGVMKILEYYNIDVAGKRCVVVGRSNTVGKPQAMLLLAKNGTVTVCHSKTQNIGEITAAADILVVAIGRQSFITADMVKDGAVVVDVGINRGTDGKLHGDVDFDGVEKKAYAITPVPGGVGPMTITMLLENTLTAAKKSLKSKKL